MKAMTMDTAALPTMQRGAGNDSGAFRSCFGSFATGVLVVTCQAEGEPGIAITINSLSSVSLDPALALFCLDENSATLAAFLRAGHFALNILSEGQDGISTRYAQKHDPLPEHFDPAWTTGAPILKGALAVADCRLNDVFGGGDHRILLGEVVEAGWQPEASPLLYFRGGYGRIGD